ncbi:hypothetical protein BKA62DRAFT_701817 [Auriculariales sp. MPI-PUGE-AT-0066]|nr:hypothetical protein BKA62DRAFT_701817 [Auriculariales sp. MPI-PUGE-AT-0066]
MTIPPYLARSWDQSVSQRTQDYVYEDCTVWLQVESKKFKISRRRLTMVSPVFQDLFSMPNSDDEPIVLRHALEEFQAFIWYLEANHFEFADWMTLSTRPERFARVISIASMAHFYQCWEITSWAGDQLSELLPCCGVVDFNTLKRLYKFASFSSEHAPKLIEQVRTYWCQKIEASNDPVSWLAGAKDLQDQYLQAIAYFHILRLGNAKIKSNTGLSPLDRIRLQTGAMNLPRDDGVAANAAPPPTVIPSSLPSRRNDPRRPYDSWAVLARSIKTSSSDPLDPLNLLQSTDDESRPAAVHDSWPQVYLLTKYSGDSLWALFDHSPMGFELSKLTISGL